MGITASIGVANNKITAKLGSDYKKPDAITRIEQDNYKEIVYPLPVEDLLYVGPATSKKAAGHRDQHHRPAGRVPGGCAAAPPWQDGSDTQYVRKGVWTYPLSNERIIFQTSSPSATVPLRPGT